MTPKIYIQDWLQLKPYQNQTKTDSYYLKLSNDVLKILLENGSSFDPYFETDNLKGLAVLLTSYFEDIISETNIWNSFVCVHKELYNKELPIYLVEEYFEEEINIQDVAFLIWYFINTAQLEKFASPFYDFIRNIAKTVMDLFIESWDKAPQNEYLKSLYSLKINESDFYPVRDLIDRILFSTYLFYSDTSIEMIELENKIVRDYNDEENIEMLLIESRLDKIHKVRTRLLALNGAEWTAEILGKEHPLRADILNISPRINSYFFYKMQDNENVYFEHIASGKKFVLTKKSFSSPFSKSEPDLDTIFYMAIVKWKNEWWLSGTLMSVAFSANLILDEKNSVNSRMMVSFLDHKQHGAADILDQQLTVFKAFTSGSQIVFLSANRIEQFQKEFIDFFNASLNLTEQEKSAAADRTKKSGYFGGENENINYSEFSESGLIYFNPKSGMEIVMGVNSAFPLPNNPFFKQNLCDEHTVNLLMNENYSPELVLFCLEKCKVDLPFYTIGLGSLFLSDLDFLMRFWKPNNYHTRPAIAFTG